MVGQDNRALDVFCNPTEEAAGGEEGLGGADDDGADGAVQDRLSLISSSTILIMRSPMERRITTRV